MSKKSEQQNDKGFKCFRFAMARLGFNKESIIDNLPDYLDGVSSEQLAKMSIREIYFTYKFECETWIEENLV